MIKNPVPWPNGKRCAVTFTWDMDADSILHLTHPNDADTRISTNSMLKYGPIIAIERIVTLLEELGVKHSFFIPGWCIERYPEAVKMVLEGGHELAHHGYLHEYPNGMSRDQEEYWTKRAVDVIGNVSGKTPRGYRAPWYRFSKHSLEILVENGFTYDVSLMGDDNPHIIRCPKGELIELPGSIQLDDWPQYVHNPDVDYMMSIMPPRHAKEVYMAEFEAMYQYHGHWVNCFHPFVSGQVARLMSIKEMILEMKAKGDVWFATGEEVAAYTRKLVDDGKYKARVDDLPYYTGRIPEFPASYMPAG